MSVFSAERQVYPNTYLHVSLGYKFLTFFLCYIKMPVPLTVDYCHFERTVPLNWSNHDGILIQLLQQNPKRLTDNMTWSDLSHDLWLDTRDVCTTCPEPLHRHCSDFPFITNTVMVCCGLTIAAAKHVFLSRPRRHPVKAGDTVYRNKGMKQN